MNINKIGKKIFKNYVYIKQHDETDCAAACLAMISREHGLKIPITKVREMAGTDRRGTNALGVVTAANKLGFDAKAVKTDKEGFFEEFQLPVIAHIINKQGLLHYVVIHSISKTKIIVADPGVGLLEQKPTVFFENWTGVLFLLTPNDKFIKRNETKGIFKRFIGLILPQKAMLLNIFVASMMCNVFGIAGSFMFKIITDDVIKNKSFNLLHIVCTAFLVLGVFKILFNAFRTHLLTILSQNIDMSLILGFYKHLVHLPMKFFDNRKVGEITSRFMDSSKVREAVSGVTLVLMIDTIMAIAGGIILYLENSYLFLITLSIIIMYATIVFMFNKPLRDVNRSLMEDNAQLNSFIVESINGIQTVKAFGSERSIFVKTEKKFVKFLKSVFKDSKLINLQSSIVGFIDSSGLVVIFWIGSLSVLNGIMSFGELLAFNALLMYFFDPIKNLINIQPMLQSALVASDRLGEIFDINPEECGFNKKENSRKVIIRRSQLYGRVIFKNVSFRYGTRDWILKNINFVINPGEKVAFVGKSGSGKTTLVKLIMSLYLCEQGDVFIDNVNLRDIDLENLRDFISYIPQESFLFSETIKYNLSMGNDNISMDEMKKVSSGTRTDEFVSEITNGYDAVLEENGANLSGGQRQRLAITRALLKKPKILIMDEATSNLDSVTEQAIENAVNSLPDDVTKIIIAHRLSTVINCDKIFVLDYGEIVEVGSHNELMQFNGKYANMVKEQLKGAIEHANS
ncbi:MAG: peptidase domain-containing ABC transporter [Clostridiales bacterium]